MKRTGFTAALAGGFLILLTACGGGGGSETAPGLPPAPLPAPAPPPPAAAGTVLSSGTYLFSGQRWTYQNLRLPNPDGGHAYARYFQANGTGPHPVVVVTRPYAGIDWTGEAVDARWAARYRAHLAGGGGSPMCTADVDGPAYDSGQSGPICYRLTDVRQSGDEVSAFLLNGYSVLLSYGRFYAGGSVENDIGDVLAALRFLATRAGVDRSQIGLTGASWGGFMALYGAARAPAGVRPAAVAPAFPVTGFAALVDFLQTELPGLVTPAVYEQYRQFYDPFLRRLAVSTGTPPAADYAGLNQADLGAAIDMPVLILHDDGDTILPARLSHDFAAANAEWVEGFWYTRRDNAPWQTVVASHGEIEQATVLPAYYSFGTAWLLSRLNRRGRDLTIPYGEADLQAFFDAIRRYQIAGREVSWLLPHLLALCDRRIRLYDLTPGNPAPLTDGAAYVARSLNRVWGTALTAATVRQYLQDNGLPRP